VHRHVAPVGHGEGEFHMLLDKQHATAALLGVLTHHGKQHSTMIGASPRLSSSISSSLGCLARARPTASMGRCWPGDPGTPV